MQLEDRTQGKWSILGVTGRVDSRTSPELEAAFRQLLGQGAVWIELDMNGIRYLSSAGLRVLLDTLKAVRAASGDLRLRSPRENVREVLDLSGFSDLFTILGSEPA
jgi:anti-sigma B factor antagonist